MAFEVCGWLEYRDLTTGHTNENWFVILLSLVYFGDWVTKIWNFCPPKTNNNAQLRTQGWDSPCPDITVFSSCFSLEYCQSKTKIAFGESYPRLLQTIWMSTFSQFQSFLKYFYFWFWIACLVRFNVTFSEPSKQEHSSIFNEISYNSSTYNYFVSSFKQNIFLQKT